MGIELDKVDFLLVLTRTKTDFVYTDKYNI